MKPVTPDDLLAELDALEERAPRSILAFDADGTLWEGDVGEDALELLLEEGVAPAVAPVLAEALLAAGVDATGDATTLARRADQAFRTGRLDERTAYELMARVHGGVTEAELAARAQRCLAARGLERRLRPSVLRVLEGARRRGLEVLVVSASPRFMVVAGVALFGLAPEQVLAGELERDGDRVLPHLVKPLPYGPEKARQCTAWRGAAPLLAAFGDSLFDLDLMLSARLGVAVSPKPALASALAARHPAPRLLG